MRCKEVQGLESEALDELLSGKVDAQFHEHLMNCSSCRQRYQGLVVLKATMGGMGRVAPPPVLDRLVGAVWHPTLRSVPPIRRYPYLQGLFRSELGRLRLLGHLAGLLVTSVSLFYTLVHFGAFTLNYSQFARPGVYTYMTRPSLNESYYRYSSDIIPIQDLYDDYLHDGLSVDSARLNFYTLSKFTSAEFQSLHEDSFSVITSTDSAGRGVIECVLHSPRDPKLFKRFGQLLSTSEFDLPGPRSNSKGRFVWSFWRIFVTS